MKTVTTHEAKTQLSKLLREVEAGEEIEIRRGRKPVARLVAVMPGREPRRQPGAWKDLKLTDEEIRLLTEPMSDEDIAAFENSPLFPGSGG